MNKNLKRVIALVLAIGGVLAAAPATHLNLLTTKAYAADNSTEDFTSLTLEKTGGSEIQLYDDNDYDDDNEVDNDEVTKGDTYYAKTSASKVKVEADGPDDNYVRVFKGTSSSTKGKELGDSISLSSGTTKLIVRIYSSEPDDDVKYSDDDDVIGTYTINVKSTSSSYDDEEDADSYDDIYLDKLSVNGESISLSDSKTTYTYSVANDVTEAIIKAVPPDEDDDSYSVAIDGDNVDSDDKFKNTMDLSVGENEFKIKLENDDEDEEREYTLKITRASEESTTAATAINTATSQPSTATQVQTQATTMAIKTGWVQVSGGWQCNDTLGQPLKNQWFLDRNYGKWYYLGADGIMAANSWILTGGKYYYVGSDGAMVTNTTINKYKVGSDGAWVR